jgi:hypothetical protein
MHEIKTLVIIIAGFIVGIFLPDLIEYITGKWKNGKNSGE